MNIKEFKSKVEYLTERLKNSETAEEASEILDEIDIYCDFLVEMINDQYQVIKDVAIGDHEVFKAEIEKLFEINRLIEKICLLS